MPDLDRELRELLTDDNLQLAARPDATRIVHEGVRRRRRHRAIAASTAVAAAVAGVITGATMLPGAFTADRSTAPVDPGLQYDVAWIDRPAPEPWSPKAVEPPPPPMDAPRCLADQLKVGPITPNGATGMLFTTITLRNVSSDACLLVGRPQRVAAQSQGKPDVVATNGLNLGTGGVGGDLAPGKTGYLTVETDRDCDARYATPNTFPTDKYSSLAITLPSGTSIDTPLTLDVECGLKTGGLGVDQPDATDPVDPRDELQPAIEAPDSALAGRTLTYVVTLTNPTGTAISLSHCPGYVETLDSHSAAVAKESLGLNCSTVDQIAADSSVRYEMRLLIPDDAGPGPMTLRWALETANGTLASRTVTVQQP